MAATARKRRMVVLEAIGAPIEPFHSAGEMIGFVRGGAVDRVGRCDAQRGNGDQSTQTGVGCAEIQGLGHEQ